MTADKVHPDARCWYLRDAVETRAAGVALGATLLNSSTDRPLIIALQGELGAGKTTFVGGLLAAIGYGGAVRSPTYTLIEPYELAGRQVYHLDLYRLTDSTQLEELGVRDFLQAGAILLIEWPERAAGWLAQPDVSVQLRYASGEGRQLCMAAAEPLRGLIDSMAFSVGDR